MLLCVILFWCWLLLVKVSYSNACVIIRTCTYRNTISMAWYKTAVTPLLTHWNYCSLALSNGYNVLSCTVSCSGYIILPHGPCHDDVIKWRPFPRYWPFVRGIHRSPVISPYRGHWSGAWLFSLICAWTNDLVNNRDADDLRRHRTNYDVTVMLFIDP